MEQKYTSTSILSIVSVVLMWIMILLSVVTVFFSVAELKIYANYGNDFSVDYLSDFEAFFILLTALIGLLWILVNILFIIFYLIWKHHVFKNVQSLQVEGLKYSPGWAVGWYFIPFLNLFKPYQVMKEIWQATFYSKETEDWKGKSVSGILIIWWITWIVGNMTLGQNMLGDDTIGSYKRDAILSVVGEPFFILSGILLTIIIRRITKEQNARLLQHRQETKEVEVEHQIKV